MIEWLHIASIALIAAAAVLSGLSLGGLTKDTLRQTEHGLLALRCMVALAICADVGALLLLAQRVWDGWADGPLAVSCLLAAILLVFCPVSLFPRDTGVLLSADHSQQQRFTFCLWQMLAGFVFYFAWTIFLLASPPLGNVRDQTALWLFSAAALAGLFWSGRHSVKLAYERIETLVDQQYQAELLNFMQVIRSQRHDFNFHMQAVAGMIENHQYEECGEYVRTMAKNVERLNNVLPLKDPAVSALINTFQELALSRQVALEVRVEDQLEDLPCTTYEINSILGNLLQNAIDETEGEAAEDRWITLLIMKRSRRHIIKVSNPSAKSPEDYERIFHPGYSTKSSHEGIGLVTVQRITAKYRGTVYLEHDPGVVHFIAKLPITTKAREG